MKFGVNQVFHVYNQGNNRQKLFHSLEEYLIFLRLFRKTVLPFSDVLAYCLMPNHFHFMLYADERCTIHTRQGAIMIDPISNGFRKLLSSYARISNDRHGNTGSVFRQKTKAKCLSDITTKNNIHVSDKDYLINCFYYIHQNPLRARLVKCLEDWEFSSFKDFAGFRNGTLCNKKLAITLFDCSPKTFLERCYEKWY